MDGGNAIEEADQLRDSDNRNPIHYSYSWIAQAEDYRHHVPALNIAHTMFLQEIEPLCQSFCPSSLGLCNLTGA
jgi:hypothetical protein